METPSRRRSAARGAARVPARAVRAVCARGAFHREGAGRGFSILESMISLVVLLIGVLGLSGLQVVAVKANKFGTCMAQASELAHDLSESVLRWDYDDPRLASRATVASAEDAVIAEHWDMGRADAAPLQQQFSDKAGDANAATPGALGAYQGLGSDVDADGTPDFVRYWNVYEADYESTGVPQGKIVQIVVRWKEHGTGQRQVQTSTFKPNTEAMVQ